ncbi:MAG: hypothetical protein WDZ85_02155 [Candidatus Paceibacterota bacterium]
MKAIFLHRFFAGMNKKEAPWFFELLNDITLSTTLYIEKNIPDVEFKLLKQKITEDFIFREIAFLKNDKILCQATNKLKKNKFVNDWATHNPNEPFGKIFQNKNLKRILISKTNYSRKYKIRGEIRAEVEEKFYVV